MGPIASFWPCLRNVRKSRGAELLEDEARHIAANVAKLLDLLRKVPEDDNR